VNSMKKNTLRVPGATLSYEVRGKGPLLLLIPGGGNGCYVFEGVMSYLVDQYSVVTYDRRGLSQSTLDDPEEEQRVEAHSDDAHRLLKELGSDYEPAYVFGSSGGAVVGLDLVARHPEQVNMLIAHEPPTHLVPESDPIEEMRGVREVYLRSGIMAAFYKLMEMPGMGMEGQEMDSRELAEVMDRNQHVKNMKFLFEHEFVMYDRYQLDFAALKSAGVQTRIVLAGGEQNEGSTVYRSAAAVAERLGTTVVEFPGQHVGYVTNPRTFAQRLLEVLSSKVVG